VKDLQFVGFQEADFDVFAVEGLEPRMERLKATLRPKLQQLGEDLAPTLSELTGEEMFAHVAKHARRVTNPPKDSWVAWSKSPRGYKMFPHFQIGAWYTHAFIQWGIIYESQMKGNFGEKLMNHLTEVRASLPGHYHWYPDHTNPNGLVHAEMTDADFERIATRLTKQKNGEVMVGIVVPREEAVRMDPAGFERLAVETFQRLTPLYRLAFSQVE
jgi:uncharacterized protein YktB (UPF0637 family)